MRFLRVILFLLLVCSANAQTFILNSNQVWNLLQRGQVTNVLVTNNGGSFSVTVNSNQVTISAVSTNFGIYNLRILGFRDGTSQTTAATNSVLLAAGTNAHITATWTPSNVLYTINANDTNVVRVSDFSTDYFDSTDPHSIKINTNTMATVAYVDAQSSGGNATNAQPPSEILTNISNQIVFQLGTNSPTDGYVLSATGQQGKWVPQTGGGGESNRIADLNGFGTNTTLQVPILIGGTGTSNTIIFPQVVGLDFSQLTNQARWVSAGDSISSLAYDTDNYPWFVQQGLSNRAVLVDVAVSGQTASNSPFLYTNGMRQYIQPFTNSHVVFSENFGVNDSILYDGAVASNGLRQTYLAARVDGADRIIAISVQALTNTANQAALVFINAAKSNMVNEGLADVYVDVTATTNNLRDFLHPTSTGSRYIGTSVVAQSGTIPNTIKRTPWSSTGGGYFTPDQAGGVAFGWNGWANGNRLSLFASGSTNNYFLASEFGVNSYTPVYVFATTGNKVIKMENYLSIGTNTAAGIFSERSNWDTFADGSTYLQSIGNPLWLYSSGAASMQLDGVNVRMTNSAASALHIGPNLEIQLSSFGSGFITPITLRRGNIFYFTGSDDLEKARIQVVTNENNKLNIVDGNGIDLFATGTSTATVSLRGGTFSANSSNLQANAQGTISLPPFFAGTNGGFVVQNAIGQGLLFLSANTDGATAQFASTNNAKVTFRSGNGSGTTNLTYGSSGIEAMTFNSSALAGSGSNLGIDGNGYLVKTSSGSGITSLAYTETNNTGSAGVAGSVGTILVNTNFDTVAARNVAIDGATNAANQFTTNHVFATTNRNFINIINNVGYFYSLLSPSSQLTNYIADAAHAEREINGTNAIRFTAFTNLPPVGAKMFVGITITNFSGDNQTIAFTNAANWVPYETNFPSIITNGKTARVVFEVTSEWVRYGVKISP